MFPLTLRKLTILSHENIINTPLFLNPSALHPIIMCPTTPVPRRNVVSDIFAILKLDQERRQRREMERTDLVLNTRKIRSLTFDQEDEQERKRQCCQPCLSFDSCMNDQEQSPRSMASYDDENLLVPTRVQELSRLCMPALRPRRMGDEMTNLPIMLPLSLSSPTAFDDLPFMPM